MDPFGNIGRFKPWKSVRLPRTADTVLRCVTRDKEERGFTVHANVFDKRSELVRLNRRRNGNENSSRARERFQRWSNCQLTHCKVQIPKYPSRDSRKTRPKRIRCVRSPNRDVSLSLSLTRIERFLLEIFAIFRYFLLVSFRSSTRMRGPMIYVVAQRHRMFYSSAYCIHNIKVYPYNRTRNDLYFGIDPILLSP